MNLFRKKSLGNSKTAMHRHLRLVDLILLGIGSMVGTGIFTVTGLAAAEYAGPALVISILIAAFSVGLTALFYAEYASRIPANGGAYGYLYSIFGEFPAWLAGWLTIMEFLTAVSSVASGWGAYLKGLLANMGITLPTALNGTFNPQAGTYIDILPVLVLGFVVGVVLLNSKAALRFNSALVILKFSALALFLLVGIFHLQPANWSNFSPYGFGAIYGGEAGIMAGASLMFFAFLGFESISLAIDEVKQPEKNVPKGIVISLSIVTILYILVTLVLTGMVHYSQLNVADAVAFALRQVGMDWAASYVSIVAILTLITVCISMTYALSRMVYSISRDGLLPKSLSQLTTESKVPKNATILVGIFAAICAGIFPLASIASFLNICTLAYLILLAAGIIRLRQKEGPAKEGQFSTPLVPILPIISILICLSFMFQYGLATWLAFFLALLIGTGIYLFYGYKHSELNHLK
ncbi:amino acid permease [Streptococcus suis]|nr:amino acid permease [Streptococcus suis]